MGGYGELVDRPVRRGRRWWRWFRGLLVVIVVLALVVFAGGGWYFSEQIRRDALRVDEPLPSEYPHKVVAVGDETLTFALGEDPPDDLLSSEILGVVWEGGYGQVGAVISRDGTSVARTFTPITGMPAVGEEVALDAFAFPSDPEAVGIAWEEVVYESGVGPAAAWYVPGERSTWAIFVHGRGAHPGEALRALPTFVEAGFPALLITYRNDEGATKAGDRLARFGATEWEDLDGAVRYTLEAGAEDVVLIGYSMGGAIVASFLLHSGFAAEAEAAILDAPALDLGAMVDARAADTDLPLVSMPVPAPLTWTAKWIASLRFGFDWGEIDYVARAGEFTTPMLIIHGTEDDDVPISVSEEFTDAAPAGLVTLVPFEGAGHVRAWNTDPEGYRRVLEDFLAGIEG
jgi:alpha-beta hydrolase superfamily lysophospholipase